MNIKEKIAIGCKKTLSKIKGRCIAGFCDEALVKELLSRSAVIDNSDIHQMLDNSGFFGYKLWSKDDVMGVLEQLGYEPDDDNFAAVMNTGYLKKLHDCTDSDWMIIEEAVQEANRRKALVRLGEDDGEEEDEA